MPNNQLPSHSVAVSVEMRAFSDGRIRTVFVPKPEWDKVAHCSTGAKLELVYAYGQNDCQPQQTPSVSVGDVIRLNGERWMVDMMGFAKVDDAEIPPIMNFSRPRNMGAVKHCTSHCTRGYVSLVGDDFPVEEPEDWRWL